MVLKNTIEFFFQHIFDFPYALQLVCVAFSTVLLLGKEYKRAWRYIVPALETLILALLFLVLNVLISLVTHYLPFLMGLSNAIMFLIGITVYTLVRSDKKPLCRIAFCSVIFATAVTIADMGTIFGNTINMFGGTVDIAVTKIISYLLIVVCAFLYKCFPLSKYEMTIFEVSLNVGTNFLAAFAVISFDVLEANDRSLGFGRNATVGLYASLIMLVVFCMCILTYFLTFCLCREKQRALNYQKEREASKSLQEQIQLSGAKIAELSEIRHDLKNQYAYMQNMLREQKYDEMNTFFEEQLGTFAKPLYQSVFSGNRSMDLILNLELTKAVDKGIKFNCKVVIPPTLSFEEADLVSLVTNIIDNAVEACVREKPSVAAVNVDIGVHGDYMCLIVTNPTNQADMPDASNVETSKRNKAEHGFGMKIIRRIVKKYNGHYRCYVKDLTFYSECMLDMNCLSNHSDYVLD